ncbi:hypothetical protein [Clostridium massiliamazoniense]|uniref:hypothetical protein n=1 Tax=Clostridium massiliamazoniense TaxID=1347366 RepID=UPI000B33AE4E|nr:hypothetical protein [Clostridium massiliamazoniense]
MVNIALFFEKNKITSDSMSFENKKQLDNNNICTFIKFVNKKYKIFVEVIEVIYNRK